MFPIDDSEDGEMKTGFKLFSLLPHKKVRPINIKINTTILGELHSNLNKSVPKEERLPLKGRELWDYYFDIKRITKIFANFLVTDGMSASLCVSRPKKETKVCTQQNQQKRARELYQSATRVVAVNPGTT